MASIEARNLCKTYQSRDGNVVALQDVSLQVTDSEFVSILGPSGCGKSTLLRILDGLTKSDSGTVMMDGKPVERPTQERGFVFQSFNLFPWRTVRGNIEFGMEVKNAPKTERQEVSRRLIQLAGLQGFETKYPHELSGGMRQRVAIARTLILQPRIILMDEPFGALDPQTRMNMQDLTLALWRDVHATVFFITHSIEEAVFLGDRVYVMSNSPGTMLEELALQMSDRPSKEMQRDLSFQETVYHLRDLISQLEESRRAGT